MNAGFSIRRFTVPAAVAAASAAVSFSFVGLDNDTVAGRAACKKAAKSQLDDSCAQQEQPTWPIRLAKTLVSSIDSTWNATHNQKFAHCDAANNTASKDSTRAHFAALLSDADKKCRADLATNTERNLKLVQAHVVFRHGARSAVWKSGLVAHVDWGPICGPVNTPPGLAGYSSHHPEDASTFDDINAATPAAAGTGPEDEERRRKVSCLSRWCLEE
jgi:hypothetical protein